MKFIHAADIHLDSALHGLERYEGAPVEEIRSAMRRAFDNLIELAIDEEVAFVLLVGGLYDGDWKDIAICELLFHCGFESVPAKPTRTAMKRIYA